jgi:hypothetical protein
MYPGAKVEQAKYMMKSNPLKGNKKAEIEIYSKSRFLFCF